MTKSRRRLSSGVVGLVIGLLAAACSGGITASAPEASVTTRPTTTLEFNPLPLPTISTTSTTEPPTSTSIPGSSTTTSQPRGPVAQLTGLVVVEELTHPALVIKIDNHEDARPQFGLNIADVVFEEIVEGNITRFAAVFHSQNADPVGPVRSARTGDFDILNGLNTPLFANSGGNPTVLRLLRSVDSVNANVNALPDLYFREPSRSRPHDLLTRTSDLIEAKSSQGDLPPVLFEYRSLGDELPDVAEPIVGIDISYGGINVSYDWDEDLDGWARSQKGQPHVDSDGVQVAPPNVIVQFISYGRSPADATSPHARLIGEGEAFYLIDGHLIEGVWTRDSAAEITKYTLADGTPIELDRGRTWIALPRIGQVVTRSDSEPTTEPDDS